MTLARFWKWLWRRPVVVTQHPPTEDGSRGAAARARFWSEFRAGQREADTHAAASPLGPGVRGGGR
jgi:hypothetical protein